MGPLVNQKLREWTEGLDTRQSMIAIFSRIRDIPYALVPGTGPRDPDTMAETMLRQGRGSCAPKHYLLAAMFRSLNLNVVYATIPFRWSEQEIRYPSVLREEAAGLPVAYHLACRVQIGCRWALIDATWDPPLAPAGFPVNLNWDGIADTRCAVRPRGISARAVPTRGTMEEPCRDPENTKIIPFDGERDHWDANGQERYYRLNVEKRTLADVRSTTRFYDDLNLWMENVRESGYKAGIF